MLWARPTTTMRSVFASAKNSSMLGRHQGPADLWLLPGEYSPVAGASIWTSFHRFDGVRSHSQSSLRTAGSLPGVQPPSIATCSGKRPSENSSCTGMGTSSDCAHARLGQQSEHESEASGPAEASPPSRCRGFAAAGWFQGECPEALAHVTLRNCAACATEWCFHF